MPPAATHSPDPALGRQLDWVRERLARLQPGYRFKWDVYFDRLEDLARTSHAFLDAGCGDNKTARELHGPSLCVGVDQSPCKRMGSYVCAHLESLPFQDGAFDLLGCRHVAEHLEHPDQVTAEWRRVLKPGGRALIQTVNRRSLLIRLARMIRGRWRDRILKSRYAHNPADHYPTFDRLNTPDELQHPPEGFTCESLIMTQDVDLQSKPGFWFTYLLILLTNRRPQRRSVITAEWKRL